MQFALTAPYANGFFPAAGFIAAFLFWDNLLVFTLGALLPLGFTDGSTIIKLLRLK